MASKIVKFCPRLDGYIHLRDTLIPSRSKAYLMVVRLDKGNKGRVVAFGKQISSVDGEEYFEWVDADAIPDDEDFAGIQHVPTN